MKNLPASQPMQQINNTHFTFSIAQLVLLTALQSLFESDPSSFEPDPSSSE
ncbi:hypothetical protein [Flavitalea sp.]|nr:hypothetical protein [Flavitalea sp.]